MNHKLINSILVVLLLSVAVLAQSRPDAGSLGERARKLKPLIVESANRYGIDPHMLAMICFVESRFRIDAVSPKGARGLMQFMPETAARYGLRNPNDPKAAIDAAARYLRDLLHRFGGRVDLAVAAYNAGEGAVESFRTGRRLVLRTGKVINARGLITGGIPPYRETQAYVSQIMRSLKARNRRLDFFASQQKHRATITRDFTLDTSIEPLTEEPKHKNSANTSFIEIKDEL